MSAKRKSTKVTGELRFSGCGNPFLESDGFCCQCGRNHFGGERKPIPTAVPMREHPAKLEPVVFGTYESPTYGWQASPIGGEEVAK